MRTRCWCVTPCYVTAAEQKTPSLHPCDRFRHTDCTIHSGGEERRGEERRGEERRGEEGVRGKEDIGVRGKVGQREREESKSNFKRDESTACSETCT